MFKIIDVLEGICNGLIPKQINGVGTEYILETVKDHDSFITGVENVTITIMPSNQNLKSSLGVAIRFRETSEFLDSEDERKEYIKQYLEREIKEALITYISNIIKYFGGRVIEEKYMEETQNSRKDDILCINQMEQPTHLLI